MLCRFDQCELVACLVDHKLVNVPSKTKGLLHEPSKANKDQRGLAREANRSPRTRRLGLLLLVLFFARPAAAAVDFSWLTPSVTVLDLEGKMERLGPLSNHASSLTSLLSQEAGEKSKSSASTALCSRLAENRRKEENKKLDALSRTSRGSSSKSSS